MADNAGHEPSPLQTLILWALIVHGGMARQKDLKPVPKKPDRDALVRAGLVRAATVQRAMQIELTDRGWAWAGANTTAKLPPNTNAGTAVLAGLLNCLGKYLAVRQVALADLIRPAPPMDEPAAPAPDLSGRIRAAYLAETGGAVNRQVRLAALRTRLADVTRAALDAALLAFAQQGGAGLLPLDDPTEISAADRDAAIPVGTQMRHLLWIDR